MNHKTNNKKVLITGSSGMLGKDIFSSFSKMNYSVFGVDLVKSEKLPDNYQLTGDLTNVFFLSSVLKKIKPDIIIHCAAIVNLHTCEEKKDLAYGLHVKVTQRLAQFNPGKTKIIYISTDSVFDGKKGNYSEEDTPNPLNYYAKSKLEGEKVAQNNPNHIVIRTNIFGFNIPLLNSLAEWAIQNITQKNSIHGFSDVVFNAIYTKHLSKIIVDLVQNNFTGLINVASANSMNKYEFLIKITKALGQPKKLIQESNSKGFNFTVQRPLNTSLNVQKISRLVRLPQMTDGINDMIKDYNHQIRNHENV